MRVFVAVPTRGQFDWEFLEAFNALKELLRLDTSIEATEFGFTYGCSLLDHARSHLATMAVLADKPIDVMLWLDDDMIFQPAEVLRMITDCHKMQAIIGAPSMSKSMGGTLNVQWMPGQEEAGFFRNGELVEVLGIGTAVMAIPVSAYRKVQTLLPEAKQPNGVPIIPFFIPMVHEGYYCGEDISFCIRAREVGVPIYCDTRMRVFHKGSYNYGLEDSARIIDRYEKLTIRLERRQAEPESVSGAPPLPPDGRTPTTREVHSEGGLRSGSQLAPALPDG